LWKAILAFIGIGRARDARYAGVLLNEEWQAIFFPIEMDVPGTIKFGVP
jgi:hypothetical protein